MKACVNAIMDILSSLPPPQEPAPRKRDVTSPGIYFVPEVIEQMLCMYMEGMAVQDISGYFGLSEAEVNDILDRYAPYL